MQELFDLFYLYDYMAIHTVEEQHTEYVHLRNYIGKLIERVGTE